MDRTIANRFQLQAKINGVTLKARILVTNGVLLQWMTEGTYVTTPSWGETNNRPIFRAEVIDSATGQEYEVLEPKLFYNGTEVQFEFTNNVYMSTGVYAGLFVRSYNQSTHVTTYQFMDSPFGASNQDSDTLRIEGKVMPGYSGITQDFVTPDEKVTCIKVPEGNTQYAVCIQAWDLGSGHSNAGMVQAYLMDMQGAKVTTGITSVKWYNMDGTVATQIAGDGKATPDAGYSIDSQSNVYALTVTDPDNVQGDEVFCVGITKDGEEYKGYVNMSDLTDGFYTAYAISGDIEDGMVAPPDLQGNGGVGIVTISVLDASTNQAISGRDLYPHVILKTATGSTVPSSKIYYTNNKCTGTLKVGHRQLIDWGTLADGLITLDKAKASPWPYSNTEPDGNTRGIDVT